MTSPNPTAEKLLQSLAEILDPGLEKSLIALDMIRDLQVDNGRVTLHLVLATPAHPYRNEIVERVRQTLLEQDGIEAVEIEVGAEVMPDGITRGLAESPIKNAIAVASGKGGVGKTTVAVNLAVALSQAGARVGLLDADVYGPNVPTMLGVDAMPPPSEQKMVPAEAFGVKIISIKFLVKPGQPLIWRGPMLHSAIRQFVSDVDWGELDYLIVDLPPGTGDAPLSLVQSLPLTGAVIVTLPQAVSIEDAERGLEMFRSMDVAVLGVLENMSYLELDDGTRVDVFGQGGGQVFAGATGAPFLGAIPMDPDVRKAGDSGVPIVISHPDSAAGEALISAAEEVALAVSKIALQADRGIPLQIVE